MSYRPSRRCIAWLAVALLPAAVVSYSPIAGLVALLLDALVVGALIVDIKRGRGAAVVVRSVCSPRVGAQTLFKLRLVLQNPGIQRTQLTIAYRLPPELRPSEAQRGLWVPGLSSDEVAFGVVADRRGRYQLPCPVVEQTTPLGLGYLSSCGSSVEWTTGSFFLSCLS